MSRSKPSKTAAKLSSAAVLPPQAAEFENYFFIVF